MRNDPNAHLVGQPGGRAQLATPALMLDIDVLEANLGKMQALASASGLDLRPHAKAHKCPEIARRQIAAGAVGICVATPGEAEVFAASGITDLLLTSTFGSDAAIARLVRLAGQGVALCVVLDNVGVAQRLAQALERAGATMEVLIDIDAGRRRAGVAGPAEALALADGIAALPSLRLGGLQAYAGHLSHCADPVDRAAQAQAVAARIRAVQEALSVHAMPGRVTGGSTGAVLQEVALGVYTELQAGSYALMDTEYDLVDPDEGGTPLFQTSLRIATAVTSGNHAGLATCDAGEKRMMSKRGTAPAILAGAPEGATYRPTSDEHGTLEFPPGAALVVGALVELQAPHCDPTINLYDTLLAMRGDTLAEIWQISARGA